MSKMEQALALAKQNPTVKLVLDLNPDQSDNRGFIDKAMPGDGLAHERIKQFWRAAGICYFTADNIVYKEQLSEIVADYVGNNIRLGEQFVLLWDRRPFDLGVWLGKYAPYCAGFIESEYQCLEEGLGS